MSGFFSQLSLWEIGGLLLVIVILNTVLLKWFMDWNQSHPLDEADAATASPAQARRSTSGTAAMASARTAGLGAAAASGGNATDAGGGEAVAAGRPRRRKYLQPSTDGGGSGDETVTKSAGDAKISPGFGSSTPAAESDSAAATVAPVFRAPAPAVASPDQPTPAAVSSPVVAGRSFAEVSKQAVGDGVKLVARPVVPGPGLSLTEARVEKPLADAPAAITASAAPASAVAAGLGGASEALTKERPPSGGRPAGRTECAGRRWAPADFAR